MSQNPAIDVYNSKLYYLSKQLVDQKSSINTQTVCDNITEFIEENLDVVFDSFGVHVKQDLKDNYDAGFNQGYNASVASKVYTWQKIDIMELFE